MSNRRTRKTAEHHLDDARERNENAMRRIRTRIDELSQALRHTERLNSTGNGSHSARAVRSSSEKQA